MEIKKAIITELHLDISDGKTQIFTGENIENEVCQAIKEYFSIINKIFIRKYKRELEIPLDESFQPEYRKFSELTDDDLRQIIFVNEQSFDFGNYGIEINFINNEGE